MRTVCASSSSSVVTQPPSPSAPRFLPGYMLNAAAWPMLPVLWPPVLAPCACAASSSTMMPRLRARALMLSIGQGWPYRCTGITARVCGVRCGRRVCSVITKSLPTSQNTGRNPARFTASAVATKVSAGTHTSSPSPQPFSRFHAISTSVSASSPLATPMQCLAPT